MRVIVVKWKRIESQKKELATHNSFEKELKESILQLSTPESLLLCQHVNLPGLDKITAFEMWRCQCLKLLEHIVESVVDFKYVFRSQS